MSRVSDSHNSRGFSLVEVLVALVVCAIGLLGLAKLESLSLASTTSAGTRSLAAIEASSMAAAMHANRAYWGDPAVPVATVVTSATASLATPDCLTAPSTCTTAQMANFDLKNWALAMNQVFKNYYATITCAPAASPVNCNVTVKWSENAVAINSTQTNMANLAAPTYTIYLEP